MKAARALRKYLKSTGENENIEALLKKLLDELLSHFSINVRKVNGKKYKVSSLEDLRFSINRNLHFVHDHKIDLTKIFETQI